ncbi:MAG: hypothetical protein SWH68_00465 [Thermodesulfobacteriota bacterium]|nr:hypothetical protein [Thermodesulfobacteriota bacterium]
MKKLLVALIIGALMVLPMSAMAMDSISDADLGDITGQAGVTIIMEGDTITDVNINDIAWGDPDGFGTAGTTVSSENAGYLQLEGWNAAGTTVEDIHVKITIPSGEQLELDVASITGGDYEVVPGVTGAVIPDGKTAVKVALPDMTIDVTMPKMLKVGLSNDSTTTIAEDETLGTLGIGTLGISPGTPDALYIYAHD